MNKKKTIDGFEKWKKTFSVTSQFFPILVDVTKKFLKLTVGVDFFDQLVEDFLVERLAHKTEDVGDHVRGYGSAMVPVERVERLPQYGYLFWRKIILRTPD